MGREACKGLLSRGGQQGESPMIPGGRLLGGINGAVLALRGLLECKEAKREDGIWSQREKVGEDGGGKERGEAIKGEKRRGRKKRWFRFWGGMGIRRSPDLRHKHPHPPTFRTSLAIPTSHSHRQSNDSPMKTKHHASLGSQSTENMATPITAFTANRGSTVHSGSPRTTAS